MKKFWIKATIFILVLLIPVATLLGLLAWSGKSYEQTYYAGLSIQYDRLNSINEQKIVVVGGSNVAFGLDTELLERWTGKKVVNFGLYGSLGVKVMIDLSKTNLNRGDIVVLTPELSNESYSLYFGAESVLKSSYNVYQKRRYYLCTCYGAWNRCYFRNQSKWPRSICCD